MSKFVFLSIGLFAGRLLGAEPSLKVIPQPREFTTRPAAFRIDEWVVIALGDPTNEEDRFAAQLLQADLEHFAGVRVSIGGAEEMGSQGRPIWMGVPARDEAVRTMGERLHLLPTAELGDEGYVLDVTSAHVYLAANAAAGVFYGVQTLRQLLQTGTMGNYGELWGTMGNLGEERGRKGKEGEWGGTQKGFFPGVRIRDWPAMRYRGVSDDISRGPVPTVEYIQKQIRTLAAFKLNVLSWYIEHAFKHEKHPLIAPPNGLTAAEVREIVAYAQKYHVEIIPEQQSFGHAWQTLRHEEYADLRETMGVFSPVREGTYALLKDFYDEMAPLFPSPLFHVGCDETYGLGDGPSRELAEQIGVGGVYLRHLKRLRELLQPHGKRILFWGDIALHYPEMIPQIPKDIIVANWGYGGAESFVGQLQPYADAGLDQFVCPGVSNWSQMFPNFDNAVINIHNFVRDGQRFNALGMLNTTWDDDGETLFEHTWYGVVYAAACAWQPGGAEVETFDACFDHAFYGNPTGDPLTRAIKLLSSTHDLLSLRQTSDSFFWEDPFAPHAGLKVRGQQKRARELQRRANLAHALVAQARAHVTRRADHLAYVAFAAQRYRFLANKLLVADRIRRAYGAAYLKSGEPRPVRQGSPDPAAAAASVGRPSPNQKRQAEATLQRILASLEKLHADLAFLRARYIDLWNRENRPYWLENNLQRYDGLLSSLAQKIEQMRGVQTNYIQTGELPEPALLGLGVRRLPQRPRQAQPADLPPEASEAPWWNEAWGYRVPLLLESPEETKTDYPVEVELDFAALLQAAGADGTFDENSIRVIACEADWRPRREVPSQWIPEAAGRARGSVVWIAAGEIRPEAPQRYLLYFDTIDQGPKPAPDYPGGVRTEAAGGGSAWMENERVRAWLGSEGAHLYVWEVKALGGLDVTEPGESGWAGFNDIGGLRSEPFRLTCEAAGPVLVRYRADLEGEPALTLNFYAGAGWVEVFLEFLAGYYWAFDRTENMAADRPQPGTAIFSNGATAPVPASNVQEQVVQPDTLWAAKHRADGLTLGLLTPEASIYHHVGPGGGWGGVGLERGGEAAHFITFADVTADPAATMERLRATLNTQKPVAIKRGVVVPRRATGN